MRIIKQGGNEMGKSKRNVSSLVVYDDTTNTLTLIKRSPELRDIVKIMNDQNYHISYKPLTLHIGSATVGGVTTGGAYTTGGYNYVSGTSDSGYYQFLFEGKPVKKIKLDDKSFSIAKQSEIAPYLNDETLEIEVVEKVTYSQDQVRFAISNYKSTGYVGNLDKGYPNLEKTIKILAWICDLEDEPDLVLDEKANKARSAVGIIISLLFLGLSCASFLMMFQGYDFDVTILLTAIVLLLLGGFILVRCVSSMVRRQKRKKKIKDRIKRSRA